MKRNVILAIAVGGMLSVMIGCQEEATEAADELGVQPGRRPVPEVKRKPPGPPQAELVTEEQPGQDQPDEDP